MKRRIQIVLTGIISLVIAALFTYFTSEFNQNQKPFDGGYVVVYFIYFMGAYIATIFLYEYLFILKSKKSLYFSASGTIFLILTFSMFVAFNSVLDKTLETLFFTTFIVTIILFFAIIYRLFKLSKMKK